MTSDAAAAVEKMAATRVAYEAAKQESRQARQEQARVRREEADKARAEFRAAIEAEGLLDSNATQVVRDRVWSMAWDQGHASGWSDVRFYYDDYAELVNLVITETR